MREDLRAVARKDPIPPFVLPSLCLFVEYDHAVRTASLPSHSPFRSPFAFFGLLPRKDPHHKVHQDIRHRARRLATLPAGEDRPADENRHSNPARGGQEDRCPDARAEALEGEREEERQHPIEEIASVPPSLEQQGGHAPPHEQRVRQAVYDRKRLEAKHLVLARAQEPVLRSTLAT